jgi:sugar-specific transcriptional regulator TrmB
VRDDTARTVAEALTRLGFSQYEARAYVGLLSAEAQTGYALSNLTGVPQPKVYETLRRLVDRGVAIQVSQSPAKFVAIPPHRVLSALEREFRGNLAHTKQHLRKLHHDSGTSAVIPATGLNNLGAIVARAIEAVSSADESVYLSGKSIDLAPLAEAVGAASDRGVRIVMVYFGRPPFASMPATSFAHVSTDGRLYWRHQARHLAAVVDGESALWAVAKDGRRWQGLWMEDELFAAALKAYIRHDIYLQRIHQDLGDSLHDRYGLGLERLTDLSRDEEEETGGGRRRQSSRRNAS